MQSHNFGQSSASYAYQKCVTSLDWNLCLASLVAKFSTIRSNSFSSQLELEEMGNELISVKFQQRRTYISFEQLMIGSGHETALQVFSTSPFLHKRDPHNVLRRWCCVFFLLQIVADIWTTFTLMWSFFKFQVEKVGALVVKSVGRMPAVEYISGLVSYVEVTVNPQCNYSHLSTCSHKSFIPLQPPHFIRNKKLLPAKWNKMGLDWSACNPDINCFVKLWCQQICLGLQRGERFSGWFKKIIRRNVNQSSRRCIGVPKWNCRNMAH